MTNFGRFVLARLPSLFSVMSLLTLPVFAATAPGCGSSEVCPAVLTSSLRVMITRCGVPACAEVTVRDGAYVEVFTPGRFEDAESCGDLVTYIDRPGHYTVVVKAGDTTVTVNDVVLYSGRCGVGGPTIYVELEDDPTACPLDDAQTHADGLAHGDGAGGDGEGPDETP